MDACIFDSTSLIKKLFSPFERAENILSEKMKK